MYRIGSLLIVLLATGCVTLQNWMPVSKSDPTPPERPERIHPTRPAGWN